MSLTVDGVWKAGVWAPTVWASGVWFEGTVAVDQASNWQSNWWVNSKRRTPAEEDLERAKLGIIAFPEVKVYDSIEEAPEVDKLYLKDNYERGLREGLELRNQIRRKRAITLLLL